MNADEKPIRICVGIGTAGGDTTIADFYFLLL